MRTVLLATCLLTCSLLSARVSAAEGYWNQFRGPHANGTSEAKGLPLKFAEESKEVVWKTEVKGRAWSTPVVWGNQIWVTNAPEIVNPDGATNQDSFSKGAKPLETPLRLSAVCLDLKTGKVIHDVTVSEQY